MGDAAYGVAIDSYGSAQAGFYGPENVSFLLPEGQTTLSPDSIAILKNPPHPDLAQHFIEFVLSRAGQLLWMEPKGAPGGAVRHAINHMSVMPALYNELAGQDTNHDQSIHHAVRLDQRRTRLASPHDPQRSHRQLHD